MSYPSAPSRLPQIDVIDQVGRAFRTVLDNRQAVLEMALLPFVIMLAIEFVAMLLPLGMIGGVVTAVVHAGAFLIFGSVFLVRWYRFVLLRERVGGGMVPPGWTPFVIAAIKIGAILVAGWIVLGLVMMVPPHVLTGSLAVVAGVALGFATLRLSLIFPAAAIERPVGLRTAWDWIAGNYWRLFACVLAGYFPFLVAEMIVGGIAAIFPALLAIVFVGLQLALTFLGAAVIGALLSQLYREIDANTGPA